MDHDRGLLEQLSAFPTISFDGDVFRATPRTLNPLAPSVAGGRWMIPGQTPTLYTSTTFEGALAEIAFHWGQLSPLPSRPAAIHRIQLKARKSLRLLEADFVTLGVDPASFAKVGYRRTQEIGAAVAHLGCDGLIAPSARWECENVMVFMNNHHGDELAVLLSTEEVDWLSWAREQGIVF